MTDEMSAANTSPEQTASTVTDKIARRGLHAVQKNTARLDRLRVEYVEIGSIKPNTYNPNRQDEETLTLLCRSIEQDGFTQPIIVHRSSKEIVDGEHRWRAAHRLKMTQIPVVFVDMSDEQMRIATLRHNRARGTEDLALATDVLRDLQTLGAIEWAQDALMLDDSELNELLDEVPAPEAMMGDEYTGAWVPEKVGGEQVQIVETGSTKVVTTEVEGSDGTNSVAMTKGAVDEFRRRQDAVSAAKTDRDRMEAVQTGPRPFRLQFTFSGDEAEMVMAVLGDEPAERLLEMCRSIDAQSGSAGATEDA